MVRHIVFCLEEIEAEIEALDGASLGEKDRACLANHIAGMRIILAAAAPAAEADDANGALALARKGDDLTLIRGIAVDDLVLLAKRGVTTFAGIAGWTRADIDALGGGKALRQRIARENWIEQAALLAAGIGTAHAAAINAERGNRIGALAEALAAGSIAAAALPGRQQDNGSEAAQSAAGHVIDLAAAANDKARPRRRAGLAPVALALVLAAGIGLINVPGLVPAEALLHLGERIAIERLALR